MDKEKYKKFMWDIKVYFVYMLLTPFRFIRGFGETIESWLISVEEGIAKWNNVRLWAIIFGVLSASFFVYGRTHAGYTGVARILLILAIVLYGGAIWGSGVFRHWARERIKTRLLKEEEKRIKEVVK